MGEINYFEATVQLHIKLRGDMKPIKALEVIQERLDRSLDGQLIGVIEAIEIGSIKIDKVA